MKHTIKMLVRCVVSDGKIVRTVLESVVKEHENFTNAERWLPGDDDFSVIITIHPIMGMGRMEAISRNKSYSPDRYWDMLDGMGNAFAEHAIDAWSAMSDEFRDDDRFEPTENHKWN